MTPLRRVTVMVVVALAGGLAGWGAGNAGPFGAPLTPLANRAEVTSTSAAPVPPATAAATSGRDADAARPATVDPAVVQAAATAPGDTLDLLVSLARPAGPDLRRRLAVLGPWSYAFGHVPVAAVRLPAGRLAELRALPGVRGVYPEERLRLDLDGTADAVNARPAWNDMGVTGAGVTVAVVDSGVDFTHPDLAPAMRANFKMVDFGQRFLFPPDGPAAPASVPPLAAPHTDLTAGHGTHVAGDVAGRGTASGGKFKGMAPGAGLVGLAAGDGATVSIFSVVAAYDWLVEHHQEYGIRVVNNSYGGTFRPFDPDSPVNVATRAAVDVGMVVVFAYGNDGGEMTANPEAVAPWVIGVAAGDEAGAVAEFSSGGIEPDEMGRGFDGTDVMGERRVPLDMGLYHPAVVATGVDVVSARAKGAALALLGVGDDAALPPGEAVSYTSASGTSMAAPVAAGVAALVLEANPALRPEEVRRVLQVTAKPLADAPFHRQGYGYLDAAAAVDLARSLRPLPAGEAARRLEAQQVERDRSVLATLAHPARTWAWAFTTPTDEEPTAILHPIDVPAGTARLRIVDAPLGIAPVGVQRVVQVLDARGVEVALGGYGASGQSVVTLDLDLHHLAPDREGRPRPYDSLAFGRWTIRYEAPDAFEVAGLAAIYSDPLPKPCLPVAGPPLELRFQDDDATVLNPYPADPAFTYVGPVPAGTLGDRRPERRLAGTLGSRSGAVHGDPVFIGDQAAMPFILGGDGQARLWIQGNGVPIQETLQVRVLDLDSTSASRAVIAEGEASFVVKAGSTAEVVVQLPFQDPYQLPAGHRLGLALDLLTPSAVTLLYDSDRYPSGVSLPTGGLPPGCRPGAGEEAYPPLVTVPTAPPSP